MNTYKIKAYNFKSDAYKKIITRRRNEELEAKNATAEELNKKIAVAYSLVEDRDEVISDIEQLQEIKARIDWEIIKQSQLFWS